MDSQLFRLNQMSYQHHKQASNQQQQHQRVNQQTQPTIPGSSLRQHYSNRQQAGKLLNAVATVSKQKQQQQLRPTISNTSASSGSDQEELVQLSSLSTATTNKSHSNSSQVPILASNTSPRNQASQREMQRDQHHQMLRHQQQQRQQNGLANGQHRQAALQSHSLASLPSGNPKSQQHHHKSSNNSANSNNLASSDQLTTSSDQTIDELHHLAPHHHGYATGHHNQHHRHLSRFEHVSAAAAAGQANGSSLSSWGSQSGSRFLLGVLFTISELLLFATVFLWLYWAYQHDDGLAWQVDRKQQFNTHAALMLFGFIFLSGQAMLIHRSFSCCIRIYTKILHTILFVLATSAISLGLILAYTAQENVGPNNKPIMHFYSLHAWCGLTTVGLFVFQFVFGFVSFLILLCCDQATANYRAALLPIHKTFGLIIFSLAVATCLTGLLQTARSRLSSKLNKTDYHELAEPGIIINLIGVCLICLAILMPYIIRNLDIKRPFRSEFDRHLNKLSQLEMRI